MGENTLSLIQSEAGEARVYSVYRDMTREREEQSRLRQQYKDLIMQHYQTQGPDALVLGHCNITQNQILEIIDYTDSNLLGTFGSVRRTFSPVWAVWWWTRRNGGNSWTFI